MKKHNRKNDDNFLKDLEKKLLKKKTEQNRKLYQSRERTGFSVTPARDEPVDTFSFFDFVGGDIFYFSKFSL